MVRKQNLAFAHFGGQIGARVKRLRDQQGLTVRQLARRAGISDSAISSVETSKTGNAELKTLLAIQRGLRVPSIELLLGNADEIPPDVLRGDLRVITAPSQFPSERLAGDLA